MVRLSAQKNPLIYKKELLPFIYIEIEWDLDEL